MNNILNLSDIQSESGVIGTLIYHPEFILQTDYLKPNHFCGKENSCIYWAIQELYKDGITNIDAYNVSNKLQSHPGVTKVVEQYNLPSVQEFMELYKNTARHTLEEYKMFAENIVTLSFKRDLIKVLDQLSNDCYRKEHTLDKLSGKVYDEIDKLAQKYVSNTEIDVFGNEINEIWDEIVSRRNGDETCGILSKFPLFNEYFTFEQGELVTVQARHKQGKSILLMNEVVHKLKNGVPTLVFDTEMRKRLYTERLLSHLTGIEIKRIKNGKYSAEEEQKIQANIKWLKEQPFVYIYDPQITDEKLYVICKMLKYKMGLKFVVFDYIKSNEKSTGDNYNILGQKCDFLKNRIAGELDLAVLTACQLNRQGEVADSDKINRYSSIGIKWGFKTQEMIAKDGINCGNAFAKVYVNRVGEQMQEDDANDYIDFIFSGKTATVVEAEQHEKRDDF